MIFHEIAVEPDAIRTFRDLQCILGLAGFGKGRLISDFPSKAPTGPQDCAGTWTDRVILSIKKGDVQKAPKARELMISERKKLLRSKRKFNHNLAWIDNARNNLDPPPFSALIVDRFALNSTECTLDDLGGGETPDILMNDQHVRSIPKNPEQFAEYLLPLLRSISTLRFVDPHYLWFNRNTERTNLSPAHAKFAEAVAKKMSTPNVSHVPREVEFHMLSVSNNPREDLEIFCQRMAKHLPRNWKASAFIWAQIPNGKRFHARYIITNLGGMGSDYGLDAGRSEGDETDLYLLTESLFVERSTDFSVQGKAFNLVAGPMEFSGNQRTFY